MSYDFICGVMVVAGVILLVLAGLVMLAQYVERSGNDLALRGPEQQPARGDTHRLSVEIAEALMRNRVIDPARVSEVTQIVALKIELHQALAAD